MPKCCRMAAGMHTACTLQCAPPLPSSCCTAPEELVIPMCCLALDCMRQLKPNCHAMPCFAAPEELVMPKNFPRAPPPLLAAALAPLAWAWGCPDLFDSYSAGVILMQVGSCGAATCSWLVVPCGAFACVAAALMRVGSGSAADRCSCVIQ